ncbi:MAG: hypothetical protein JWQ87_4826 [Candidatus Sulfotelmatobacter sp.]|nr:hypothetical protein [Candidatus Sulfotelmatobacter sp.]
MNPNSCGAKNKNGQPCAAAPTETGFCHFHRDPALAAKLGRAGGRRNRHVNREASQPLPAIDTRAGVQKFISQLIGDVYAENVSSRTATGIATLLNTMIRTFDTSDLEKRIQQLEAAEAKRKEKESDSSNEPSMTSSESSESMKSSSMPS